MPDLNALFQGRDKPPLLSRAERDLLIQLALDSCERFQKAMIRLEVDAHTQGNQLERPLVYALRHLRASHTEAFWEFRHVLGLRGQGLDTDPAPCVDPTGQAYAHMGTDDESKPR